MIPKFYMLIKENMYNLYMCSAINVGCLATSKIG